MFDKFVTSLRNEFGEQEAGKRFEVFCKWFLENDPIWSKVVDKVWAWEDYPNKWQQQDLGTDLVFVDKNGLIWAVQAKCYGEHRATKKADLNSFLADTGRKQVNRRLWMQTTNRMETNAKKTLEGQEKKVTVINLDAFREAKIDYPSRFSELQRAQLKEKPTPDPHQKNAISDVVTGLGSDNKGQLIMACGTGKTFVTLWIKEGLEAKTTLVLIPSLSLLSQTLQEWTWAANADFEVLCVCSDKSVVKDSEDTKPSDAPFYVTSNIVEIERFMLKSGSKVVFCTYQSSELVAQAQSNASVQPFDLVIADEAHRCVGKVSSDFASVLDDEKIKSTKKLFATATPRLIGQSTKTKAKERDLEIVDMNDTSKFGKVLHKLTFGEAIHYKPEPLLNDYRVVIVGVDEPMVRKWIKNYEIVDIGDGNPTDARTLAAKIALIKSIKDFNLSRIISFHSRVSAAKDFSDTFLDTVNFVNVNERPRGLILSDHVSGKMKTFNRREKINRLKKLEGYDVGLLTNARCLSEGVDVPALDGVIFIDPKGSQVDIIQSVGRAMRKVRDTKEKNKGTIVLPVFIEEAENAREAIRKSNFKPVWAVLKALRSHDEEISEKLDEYRLNLGKNLSKNREQITDKIIFELPATVSPDFGDSLATYLVESVTDSWNYYFKSLKNYIQVNGDSLVPLPYIDDGGYKLGEWVNKQRYLRKLISSKRKQLLDGLPHWRWSALDAKWEKGFDHLIEHVKTFKTARVKYWYFSPDNYALGKWVHKQRLARDKIPNKNSPLVRKDIIARNKRLEELPDWSWGVNNERWEEGFIALDRHLKENDNQYPAKSYLNENGFNLGTWTRVQRQEYARVGKKGFQFPTSRIEKLESLPEWTWIGNLGEIHPNSKLYNINGEQLTLKEISKKFELPLTTINNRRYQKWDWDKIISTPLTQATTYTVNNTDYTVNKLAELLNINMSPLHRYLKAEFTAEKLYYISINLQKNGIVICDMCSKKLTSFRQILSHFHKCKLGEHSNAEKFTFNGEMCTLKQIQELSGIPKITLSNRIKKQNKTAEQAVAMGASQKSLLEFDEQEFTKAEFFKEFKIDRKKYYANYKSMTLEEIVESFGSMTS